jgi:NAD(P)-dependent dehydrogenase (short-subunit alcohol dehydrogenase family)
MQIANKTFLITGGASGLGAASARLLAQAGANVIIADVNREAGSTLAQELTDRAFFVQTDVTSETSVQQAIRSTLERFNRLDGVLNCAGIGIAEKVLRKNGPASLESFTRVISINLIGTFNVIRLASEVISKNEPSESGERGVIINTASVAAFDGQIGQAAYSASKGGIVSMTLPIAREFGRYGIRVVSIAPGMFDTPILGMMPKAAKDELAQKIPFPQRMGRPDEFAALARHILENEMLNGEVIRLDGALRMQ